MKKIMVSALLLTSLNGYASATNQSLKVMQTVLNSPIVQTISLELETRGYYRLDKAELTGVMRCPGCYNYTLTYSNGDKTWAEQFVTELDRQSGQLRVYSRRD